MAFVTDSDLAATGVGQGANMVGFAQPGLGAVDRSAMEKLRDTVSVRDFGAKGDGTTDDTAAIQAALDAVEAAGGGSVLFPIGDYKITATLDLPGQVSIEGQGQFSVLKIFGCDGINVLPSNVIGPRRVANLWFYGNGADTNTAISIDLSGSDRAQGMVFEGIYIAFFGTGVRSRGLWHSVFRSVAMNQIHRGFYLPDRSIKVLIDDCRITCGGLVTGDGASIGVQVGDPIFPERPEDLQITKSIIYGFDKGVVWQWGLFGGITNCDLDACLVSGLELVIAEGGFTFSDNWVQVNNTNGIIYGVNATAIGNPPLFGNLVISTS